jgi:Mlc titration factor MtfA (ptsG expression regulator)
MYIFAACVVLIAGVVGYRHVSRARARAALLATMLTDHQREIVARQVPLLRRLPPELRQRLEGKMNLFLEQVSFHGIRGLEVTEEMELSIAAQACLLIVNTDMWYDNLRTILLYPGAFKSRQSRHSGFVVTEKEIVRTGESWNRGPVILSWAHSMAGSLNDHDGHNVVLHEFAHQIDDMSGHLNGIPLLGREQSFAEWERVFLNAFETHVRAVERGHKTVIDPYGAEGYEEFFAVSVEVFFERPRALKEEAPGVYEQLSRLFRLDPVTWSQTISYRCPSSPQSADERKP